MKTFNEYLSALRANLAQGDATEHTHRAALQHLLESTFPGFVAVNEAQRIACGAPDFSLRKGTVPIGHIETKDIGTNLDEIQRGKGPHGEQFKRYLGGLSNWVLTDYLEFRWYVAGDVKPRLTATLATLEGNNKLKATPRGAEDVFCLLQGFLDQQSITIETAKELATRMAGITHLLRGVIDQAFKSGAANDKSWLYQWLASFRETLLPELKEGEFADIFAQTLAYGLFAARIQTAHTGAAFTREQAAFAVPRSNPFLRSIFSQMAGVDMPDVFTWAVDDLVRLLEYTDMSGVMRDIGHATGQDDPVVHFYETFLAAYDPGLREKRGVYYTPEPVVRYIVLSVDELLKTRFNKPKGLADERTLILDPATGTATFIYVIIQHIYASMASQLGAWPGYVADHFLKRVFGFELLMAPYAIAHLKLSLELEETGYSFKPDERLGIYLTNTLEEAAKRSERLVAKAISDEADQAAEVKNKEKIMVVLGNPPYSGHSLNRSRDQNGDLTFIGQLIEDYKKVDGADLKEKNPKWLQNDYVKFIRFAQWRIEKTGHGVLAYITDNSYLDNPTFRGMRRSLMQSFSEVYVLDLHGNSNKKEKDPDGGKDENVFDIKQGTAILLAIRRPEQEGASGVWHADLWGDRRAKYASLSSGSLLGTSWNRLAPVAPDYLFVPQDRSLSAEYGDFLSLKEIFPVNSIGIVTARDALTIHFNGDELGGAVKRFIGMDVEAARVGFDLGEDVQDWSVGLAQDDIQKHLKGPAHPTRILYRPFDTRFTYYTGNSRGFHCRPRREVMRHMIGGENLGMIVTRSTKDNWDCLVTDSIMGHKALAAYDINYLCPLFIFGSPDCAGNGDLFVGRRPNLSRAFLDASAKKLGMPQDQDTGLTEGVSPEDVFHYIYAIFHAPGFQERYADFLKRDFPRVPLTADLTLFRALAGKGRELVALHLLKDEDAPQINQFATQFRKSGTNIVETVEYDPGTRHARINETQYFEDVPAEAWNFHVGGYQVCEKWLKDRKGRKLNYDDTQHWQRIVVAMMETQRLMEEIDALIPEWPLR
jgi:predicted helicase